jgi:[phosphatase 2A protein]-leucine-carboxy methyltransferase
MSKAKQLCQLDLLAPEIEVLEGGTRLRSPTYCIHSVDLRTLSRVQTSLPGIDARLPTLLISECCLIYLSPDHAEAVLAHFTQLFSSLVPLAIVIYEPIRPNDSFGRTMVSNLTARGIVLQTLEKFADLKEQEGRLREHGFRPSNEESGGSSGAEAADIEFIWRTWVDEKEKERVESLEWMDEVEEFVLLARHYCVAWGWRGFGESSAWSNLAAPEPG